MKAVSIADGSKRILSFEIYSDRERIVLLILSLHLFKIRISIEMLKFMIILPKCVWMSQFRSNSNRFIVRSFLFYPELLYGNIDFKTFFHNVFRNFIIEIIKFQPFSVAIAQLLLKSQTSMLYAVIHKHWIQATRHIETRKKLNYTIELSTKLSLMLIVNSEQWIIT